MRPNVKKKNSLSLTHPILCVFSCNLIEHFLFFLRILQLHIYQNKIFNIFLRFFLNLLFKWALQNAPIILLISSSWTATCVHRACARGAHPRRDWNVRIVPWIRELKSLVFRLYALLLFEGGFPCLLKTAGGFRKPGTNVPAANWSGSRVSLNPIGTILAQLSICAMSLCVLGLT